MKGAATAYSGNLFVSFVVGDLQFKTITSTV